MLTDLCAAVIRQATMDYVTAKKWLNNNGVSDFSSVKTTRKRLLKEQGQARMTRDWVVINRLNRELADIDHKLEKVEEVERLTRFFCGQDFLMWSDLDGTKLLRGIEENLVKRGEKIG